MSYRYRGRAFADATSPRAWGICDRCGGQYNLYQLQYQHQYNGTSLYNTRFRVCPKCMDIPQPQLLNPILSPDPMPVNDPRPLAYSVNEAGTLQEMGAQLFLDSETLTPFYIDLFNGNPATGAESVLSAITGSSTRTNFADSMAGGGSGIVFLLTGQTLNTLDIVITTNVLASTNVSWVGIYDAATDGALVMSTALLNPMTAVLYNTLQFPVGNLQVTVT